MAHDFAMLACAAPRVVLSCPRRRDGAPTVPARWLVRLEAFLKGTACACPASGRGLGAPARPAGRRPRAGAPPRPCPPRSARPRRLSVTEIETWLRDPYGIYARHVLGLRALEPLEQAADERGLRHRRARRHRRMDRPRCRTRYPADAAALLRAEMDAALAGRPLRPALAAWWRPRLPASPTGRPNTERERRRNAQPDAGAAVEVPGVDGAGPGRRSRWRRGPTGSSCGRTGRWPSWTTRPAWCPTATTWRPGSRRSCRWRRRWSPPAPSARPDGPAAELAYWRLTGGYVAGEVDALFKRDPDATAARRRGAASSWRAWSPRSTTRTRPTCPQPHPGRRAALLRLRAAGPGGRMGAAEDEG